MTIETAVQTYTKTNPFSATLLKNYKLSKEGSGKETRHFEIGIAGSGIKYKCGDSLAILPNNDLELVREFLNIGGYTGDENVEIEGGEVSTLKKVLIEKFNLQYISAELLQSLNESCEIDKI